jgi:hypothetical protein
MTFLPAPVSVMNNLATGLGAARAGRTPTAPTAAAPAAKVRTRRRATVSAFRSIQDWRCFFIPLWIQDLGCLTDRSPGAPVPAVLIHVPQRQFGQMRRWLHQMGQMPRGFATCRNQQKQRLVLTQAGAAIGAEVAEANARDAA